MPGRFDLFEAVRNPAIFAAKHALSGPGEIHWSALVVGTVCAAVVGFLCIRYFLRYIQSHNFVPFVVYRIVLAAVVLILFLKQPG